MKITDMAIKKTIESINATELKQKITNKEDFQLIDVREVFEHDEFNIGGGLIPLQNLIQCIDKISTHKPVVLYCRKGIRSEIAIQRLQEKYPFNNLINLAGGIEAWKKQFENDM